ncbi:PepSY-like domain-containing protein [Anabaena sp. CCY 9402-a]|uniref:PepSY-like domain-containing protein n=1 Tax=Anabaena sp. CCY 9402-a TaxID=3103867 RepID=UPI0039C69B7A
MSVKITAIKSIICSVISLSLLTFLLACYYSPNQPKSIVVPPSVKAAFQAKYPDIPHTWQRHDYGYEAVFTEDNIQYEAEFSATGEWLETEYYVTEKEFPPIVLERIKEKRPGFIVTKYEIEITPKGIFYEVDITDGELEEELYLDSNGNLQVDLYED